LSNILVFFLVSFVWSLFVTPLSIYLSRQFGIMDEPGGRKKHSCATPRGAGVVIWVGYTVFAVLFPDSGPGLRFIATGAAAVFLFGYMDDMSPLPAEWRLAVHFFAASIVAWGIPVPLHIKAVIALWITGSTSAYNLVDGINGLSLGIFGLTVATGLFLTGSTWWSVTLGLSAGVFLWNYPLAKTFLGDGGSTLLGFICISQFSRELPGLIDSKDLLAWLAVMFLIGGVPVLDTLYSFARRTLKGRSPFQPDRGHFHHILVDRGIPLFIVLVSLMTLHALSLFLAVLLLGNQTR